MSLNASSPVSLRQHFRYHPPVASRRTGFLKCTLLVSTLFVLGFCGLVFLLRSFQKDSDDRPCKGCTSMDFPERGGYASDDCHEVCTTKGCIKTAAHMLTRMDITADPCHDFHRFSCAKYDKISMDKVRREQFMNDVAEEIIPVIAGIIEDIPKDIPKDVPGHSRSKARNFFDSCVSFYSTEEMAVPTFLNYLDYFGIKKWPFLNDNYHFTNPDLMEAITRLALYEVDVFFGYEIPENRENNFIKNSTEVSGSHYPINIKAKASRKTLFHITFSEQGVEDILGDILEDFKVSEESINETLADAFAFEDALENIQKSSRKRIRKCILNSTISCSAYHFECSKEKSMEMERWCTVAEKILNATGIREKYPFFNIILEDKIYFNDVTALLERTGHRTVAHTLALHLFLKNVLMMSYRFRRISSTSGMIQQLLKKFQEERKYVCTTWTIVHVPALLGGIFYSKIYSGKLQKEADDISNDVRRYLIEHTRNMTWMDQDARESLEKLLKRVRVSLKDYLPYISDASELDRYYERLQVTDESFLSNIMEVRKFRYASNIFHHDNRTVTLNREKPKFQFGPKYLEEVIVMDFSSFIYPLISEDRPRYSNLGFFGSFLAHEFSHAVEIFLRDRENMSSNFETILLEKKQCLIDQYSEYEMDLIETKVNGSFTLDENMADFFSIRPTYQALKSYQKAYGAQKSLPGLPFNEEQLFFISYAQWWCENNTPETMKKYLEDSHSPGKYRVLGMMRNFEPFSAAFSCPLGSPMNPEKKCDF